MRFRSAPWYGGTTVVLQRYSQAPVRYVLHGTIRTNDQTPPPAAPAARY